MARPCERGYVSVPGPSTKALAVAGTMPPLPAIRPRMRPFIRFIRSGSTRFSGVTASDRAAICTRSRAQHELMSKPILNAHIRPATFVRLCDRGSAHSSQAGLRCSSAGSDGTMSDTGTLAKVEARLHLRGCVVGDPVQDCCHGCSLDGVQHDP